MVTASLSDDGDGRGIMELLDDQSPGSFWVWSAHISYNQFNESIF